MANTTATDLIKVGVTEPTPSHDISLTDNTGKQVGLILTNRQGIRDPRGIMEGNMPRTALRTSQGNTGYDDLELPFTAEVQSTMVGGRAQSDFSKDRTKYADAFRMDTLREYPVCGPLEEAQTGLKVSYFTNRTNPVIHYVNIDYTYSDDLYYRINLGNPNAVVNYMDIYLGGLSEETTISYGPVMGFTTDEYGHHRVITSYQSVQPASLPTDPKDGWRNVHLAMNGQADAQGFINIAIKANHSCKLRSGLGTSAITFWRYEELEEGWIEAGEIIGDPAVSIQLFTGGNNQSLLFEYKRRMYLVNNNNNGSSAPLLFVNGYAGQAKAVDMALYPNITDTQLNLAGINLAGAIILIIDGPGETELNPWRKIVSNTYDGKVSVDTPWKIAQTSATTFVILDTNIWTEIKSTGLDKPVTDVAVVNDMVIFAMGDAHELVYMNESNVAGTWRRAFKADTTVEDGVTGRKADLLEPIVNETGELYLWRARSDGAKVDCAYMTSVTYAMINASSADYMTFDINRKERAVQQLIITRATADIAAENTKKSRTVIDDKLALTRSKEDAQLASDRASTDYARILALTAADKDDVLISLARTHDDAQITMDRCDEDIAYDNGDHPDPEKITSLTRAHDDAVTVKARAAEDEATESAKANPDEGYITSLQRAQTDAQLSHDRITDDIAFEHARTDIAYQLSLTRAKADALLTHNRAVSDTALRVTALLPANDERLLTLDRTYDDALTEVSRNTADLATIDARTDYGSDVGYLTSLARIIEEATWKVSLTAGHESQYLPKYVVCGNTDSRIKNIVPYGTPTIPYIIKEDSIGSILNNIYDEVPIPELRAVRSEYNGIAAMAYGVYLYFVMEGCMIERYYDQRLDDLGPNRADGLPVERMGVIRKLIPYPGRFYAAIDAGPNGYSSILCSNELGWHEIYRMPILGRSITDIVIQTIPGAENPDRLWVGCENTIFKLPIAINPTVQSGYQYYGLAGVQELPYIITSWIDYGMKDINKYFHSVTLFADYPTGTITTGREFEIRVYYRLRENAPWVLAGKAPTPLAARPRSSMGDDVFPQEVELDAKGHNTSGKKIQLKFEFQINTTALNTPRLTAWVLNGVLRMPVKKSWQVTFALEPKKDLQDKILANNYSYLINTISDWANSAKHNTPLVMHTCDVLTDNKLVFIDPASISPINVILEQNQGNNRKQYDHLAQMTLYEV